MLYFINDGILDPKMVQLFGVSVKESDSAIGFFGSGMKYAIAITLRLGGKINIWSGDNNWTFFTKKAQIRGKDFDLVYMNDGKNIIQLPFSLDLGKTWKPWMAYREFYSNAVDEGGNVFVAWDGNKDNKTVISVSCKEIDEAHFDRTFILNPDPICVVGNELEIHKGKSQSLFYKGIQIHQFTKPGNFTYNILNHTALTEDRTLLDSWATERIIQKGISNSNETLLSQVLTNKNCWEWGDSWDDLWYPRSETPELFTRTVEKISRLDRNSLPPSVIRGYLSKEIPPAVSLSLVNKKMLERAKDFCSMLSHPITNEVIVVDNLSSGVLGAVIDEKIVLSLEAFRQGTKRVAGTLLEEQIHLNTKFTDCCYPLQNYLIDLVISLGEDIKGEPI